MKAFIGKYSISVAKSLACDFSANVCGYYLISGNPQWVRVKHQATANGTGQWMNDKSIYNYILKVIKGTKEQTEMRLLGSPRNLYFYSLYPYVNKVCVLLIVQ